MISQQTAQRAMQSNNFSLFSAIHLLLLSVVASENWYKEPSNLHSKVEIIGLSPLLYKVRFILILQPFCENCNCCGVTHVIRIKLGSSSTLMGACKWPLLKPTSLGAHLLEAPERLIYFEVYFLQEKQRWLMKNSCFGTRLWVWVRF